MNRRRESLLLGLMWVAAVGRLATADEPKPIVVDEAPVELRNVAPRLWAATFSPDGFSLAVTAGWNDPREPGHPPGSRFGHGTPSRREYRSSCP